MNPELRRLIEAARAGFGLREPLDRESVLMVHNAGEIGRTSEPVGDFAWNRGFNLVLLDRRGTPTHYCKCRGIPNEQLELETAVLEALARAPEVSAIVPQARGARSGRLQLQMSTFLPGVRFQEAMLRMPEADWLHASRRVLEAADALSSCATVVVPHLRARVMAPLVLDAEAQTHLDYLGAAGIPELHLEALSAAVRLAGTIEPWPQHGDLWPGNVLWHRGTPRIIDFEIFGRIRVPLYDVFHWLRVCFGLRPDAASLGRMRLPWVDAMSHDTRAVRESRALVTASARRRGLGPTEVVGAFAYYAVDIAARIHRRGTAGGAPGRMLAEVTRLAELLQDGVRIEERLLASS